MNLKTSQIFLGLILIIMNSYFLIITLKQQDIYSLIFNMVSVSLNIVYIILDYINSGD